MLVKYVTNDLDKDHHIRDILDLKHINKMQENYQIQQIHYNQWLLLKQVNNLIYIFYDHLLNFILTFYKKDISNL